MDLLAQIRRTNEGDDTADSPGYSLQLFRIPVSVLPGKHTDKGHGAEITMTLTPALGDDLLPTTFRNLLINDLLHQLAFPLTEVLGDEKVIGLLDADFQVFVRVVTQLNDYLSRNNDKEAMELAKAVKADKRLHDAFVKFATKEIADAFESLNADQSQSEQVKGLRESRNVRSALQKGFPTSFNSCTFREFVGRAVMVVRSE
ncbi:hypothetical protein [Gemmata obscuriglobus]|uniref:Uncharacterized protein n=1 Tax=Gemmata obscuriglobus TaxID=114 RepID=A0A2Z3H015_9BACT|nr:hypothetical protein [Gemmata obscuriglobus]AWM40109.1 hypothetical protein C1280_25960 [Gemmata obscuriglobus]